MADGEITVLVKNTQGNKTPVKTQISNTVEQFKVQLRAELGIKEGIIGLVLGGK